MSLEKVDKYQIISKIVAFVVLVGLTAILTGCKNQEKDEYADKTVFKYNEPGGITSLDPAFAKNVENIWPVHQMFNGLVQMNENLEVEPCIAEKYEVSEDGKVYTFTLRNDVFFHDDACFEGGKARAVNAYDFEYSFFRIIDKEVASPGRYIFNNLDKLEENNFLGFVATNENTFKIYLKQPFPPFLGLLTMDYCSVVPEEAVKYYGNDFRRNPIGTGPFKFKMWREGEKLVMVKNENYFESDGGEKLPYLDAVSISFMKDPQVEFLDFVRGNFDFKSGIHASFKDEILTHDGELKNEYASKFSMQKQPWLETVYLGILVDDKSKLMEDNPLKEKSIRQAINYGFDRDKMVKYLRNNIGSPATAGFVPHGIPSFDKEIVEGYTYNPEKAKELLYVAGFPEGEGLPEITLATTPHYLHYCEYVQHELAEVGITVKIETFKEAVFRGMVDNSHSRFFTKSWIADYPDAENFLALFYSENFTPNGPNYTHFRNYQFDKLYNMAINEVNDSIRFSHYHQMDKIIIEQAPIVPLFYNEVVRFVQKNIEGLESNSMNMLSLKRVKKTNSSSKE